MSFIVNNWAEILLAIQIIVRLTPTKADDKITSKWGKLLNTIMVGSKTIK